MGRYSGKTCRLLTMLFLTAAFFLLEVVYGYITNSVTLIADSFHMLSDVLALVIAFVCMKFSKRQRCPKNTYGWARAEVLGALVNTVFLIALSFSIILEAIQRLFQYEYIKDPEHVLMVGIAGFVVNIIGLFLFHGHGGHGHSHSHRRHSRFHGHSHDQGHKNLAGDRTSTESEGSSSDENSDSSWHSHESLAEQGLHGHVNAKKDDGKPKSAGGQMNMHGVFLHVLGDAFGSIVVIVNAVVNWQVHNEFLRRYLDPILSLVICIIIICTSIPLLRASAMVLLQTVPSHIDVDQIQRKLLTQFGHRIMSIHDFHVWRLAGNRIVATGHIVCRGNLEYYMRLAEKIKEFFHEEGIHSTTIQLELLDFDDINAATQCILKCPRKVNTDHRPCTTDVCCITQPASPIQTVACSGVRLDLNTDKSSPLPLPSPDLSHYATKSSYI